MSKNTNAASVFLGNLLELLDKTKELLNTVEDVFQGNPNDEIIAQEWLAELEKTLIGTDGLQFSRHWADNCTDGEILYSLPYLPIMLLAKTVEDAIEKIEHPKPC